MARKRKDVPPPATPAAENGKPGPAAAETSPVLPYAEALEVPLDAIRDDPGTDHREAPADLAELVESIRTVGLLQPIVVVRIAGEDYCHLAAGRRRVAACRGLGHTKIKAEVYEAAAGTDPALVIRRIAAVENLHRADLNPVEEALAVSRLLDELIGEHVDAWWQVREGQYEEVAALLGKSAQWVRNRAFLTRLCPKVRDLVAARKLPLAQAREVAKLAGAEDQAAVAGWAVSEFNGQLHVHSIERVRQNVAQRLSTLRGVPWEPDVAFAGRPACEGCPDNSAHACLFGADAKDTAPEARCLNTPCYRAKMRASEAALKNTVARLKAKKDVAPTVAGVRGAIPEYVKPATAARHLAQARGVEPKAKAKKGQGPAEVPWEKRPENLYRKAHDDWEEKVETLVAEALCADGMRLTCFCVAILSKTYRNNAPTYGEPTKAQRAKVEPVLRRIASGTEKDLALLAADVDLEALFRCGGVELWVQRSLAGLLDVTLPREPQKEDFLPKPEAEAKVAGQAGKKKAAKKAGRKNVPAAAAVEDPQE